MFHVRTHLSEVCRWSTEGEIEAAEIAAAALGMAAPLVFALISGNLAAGLAAAMGSLAVGRVEITAGFGARLRREAWALASVLLAALAAVLCAGHGGLTSVAMVLLAGIAAIMSGFSRNMAAAATRYLLFLMIVGAVATPTQALETKAAAAFLGLVAVGALWTSALSLALGTVVRWRRHPDAPRPLARPAPTMGQKYARWRRSLASFAGWDYPLRITGCIGIAALIDAGWPGHHLHWISLTVAILTQRKVEPVPVKTTQRALGTAIGVIVAAIALHPGLPAWALVAVVGFLAGARPLLRVRSYLAYSVVMTPLIMLIIDEGRTPDPGLLFDRLTATLIGAALVIGANLLVMKFAQAANRAVP